MTMKAFPGSPLEVVKAEFLFHLLVCLLANPTRLDGGRQGAQVGQSPPEVSNQPLSRAFADGNTNRR